jgi:hypothetical protein
VHAHEQDLRLLLRNRALHLRDRPQAFTSEAVCEHGNVDVDARVAEQIEGLGDVPGDRLLREDAFELGRKGAGRPVDVMLGDRVEDLGHGWSPVRIDGDR